MASPITLLGRSRRGRRHRRGLGSSSACRKANGRVKKGWRLGRGGRCIKAKGRR